MAGFVEVLPPTQIEGHVSSGIGHEEHPMRIMTRRVAGLDAVGWDGKARAEVVEVFDALAPEWHTRSSPQRTAVVLDAFERGLGGNTVDNHVAIEVGSGIGSYSALIANRFDTVLSVDVSAEMVRHAPAGPTYQVLADSGLLPISDRSADAVIAINAFLFPHEVARVLRVGGTLIWVNSSGEETPIHLSTEDVVAVLPFPVEGRESRAGAGTWCVLRRTG